ncbi:hypothetical protein IV203_008779 [Nitzschia inconspicua]|uniref:Uncharacterized protein n=1 Tax=Nitzschia inconspicua TaxID=303405 RepID=A0A9K3L0V8_9STRA|nr:hypothetical protein IV203_008779 [Nitzschia inconspicua]
MFAVCPAHHLEAACQRLPVMNTFVPLNNYLLVPLYTTTSNNSKTVTMSAQIAKLFNPAFYQQTWAATRTSAYAKFHPSVRENGSSLLWYSMIGICVTMYTGTYISRVYPEVQHKRAIQRAAMAEYYEKHGGGDHH